jgi:hypothetical protein
VPHPFAFFLAKGWEATNPNPFAYNSPLIRHNQEKRLHSGRPASIAGCPILAASLFLRLEWQAAAPRRTAMIERLSTIPDNPAIAQCCKAWLRAFDKGMAEKDNRVYAAFIAGKDYRRAIPPLAGEESIRNFIACVAHGMLIGAVTGADATKLLYAAQVALAAVRRQPSSPKVDAA